MELHSSQSVADQPSPPTEANAPSCRTCGSTAIIRLGALPDSRQFAGQTTRDFLPGGFLWRCSNCDFVFRFPLLLDNTYDELYKSGELDLWDSEEVYREDFRLITALLKKFDGQSLSVLDFGCYTGKLLASLPTSFRLFGVEPNTQAAAVAANKGIKIINLRSDGADESPELHDVIMLSDVIEHVPNPRALLQQLRVHLKPQGLLIVTSGDSEAWLWRLTKARFWYCSFPEHISFIGQKWLGKMATQTSFTIIQIKRFNYRGKSQRIIKVVAAVVFWLSPAVYRLIRRTFSRGGNDVPTPGNGATRDHLFCVLSAR
jgi:2-polyprenyl-3-methyl-5-hydroxy-6-metoxy-1,4-benzoquinol methylase